MSGAHGLTLQELIAELRRLDRLRGEERVKAGRALVAVARASVTRAADAGVADMADAGLTRREIREQLGGSQSLVDDALTRHKRANVDAR